MCPPSSAEPDWTDTLEALGRSDYPDFRLSRRCFFCGDDASASRANALAAYVASGSWDSSGDEEFATATDAWICHSVCVSNRQRAADPEPPADVDADPDNVERSPFCFFCGVRADVELDDAWAIFAVTDLGSREAAWLCHLECLYGARSPDAPVWRHQEERPDFEP